MKATQEMISAFWDTHGRVMGAGGTESFDSHKTQSGQINIVTLTAIEEPPTIIMLEKYAKRVGGAIAHNHVTTVVLVDDVISAVSDGNLQPVPVNLLGDGITEALDSVAGQPPGWRLADAS